MGELWKRFVGLFWRKPAPIAQPTTQPAPKKKKPKPKKQFCVQTDKVCRTEHGAKGRAKQKHIRAYKCQWCGTWHLTHKKNKLTLH